MDRSCKKESGGVKRVILINQSDLKFQDGEMKLKRKYGKFTRPVYTYDPNNNKSYLSEEEKQGLLLKFE